MQNICEERAMITISGTGCSLMDYLYTNIDFSHPYFERYRSRKSGDGGLVPGNLVFLEDFERFAGCSFSEVREQLAGNRQSDSANLGGPSIVSLINASQLLEGTSCKVSYFGGRGGDLSGEEIMRILSQTSVDTLGYRIVPGTTPFTNVFSDPRYDGGHGERTFINNVGAAGNYGPDDLDAGFFDADIVVFGGTALVPRIHDNLGQLLLRARKNNARGRSAITVVNTVYDFRSQARDPESRWKLGEDDNTYCYIDLLVTDREEAFRLSGMQTTTDAVDWFRAHGVSSAIITEGARNIALYSDGTLFEKHDFMTLPVSDAVRAELVSASERRGDTTGCGDNFAGGVLASLAMQLEAGKKKGALDLVEACSWAVASGGFCCFYYGGTYHEQSPGEKKALIDTYYKLYRKQIGREIK